MLRNKFCLASTRHPFNDVGKVCKKDMCVTLMMLKDTFQNVQKERKNID